MNNNDLIPLLPEMAVFVTVADEESFSQAGIKLGMAASSVSRSINRLERRLQTKLLERTTRKVKLSTVGADVYVQCKEMLDSARTAVHAAQSMLNTATGVIRIAAPKAFSKQVLSPIILEFLDSYPGISVKLRIADHFIDPIGEEIDVIFRLTDQPLEGLISKTLTRANLIICASQKYLEDHGHPTHPKELISHQCISLGEQVDDAKWRFTKSNQKILVNTQSRFAVNHTEIRKAAVLRDMGISTFPDFTVQSEIESGELIQILPDWHISGNYQGNVILQYAQTSFMPVPIRKFIDFVQLHFQQRENSSTTA
ncbi:LysR family transcriptional regulator [Microbulbifer sp. ZKSA006]|uniref:LysR family transcriptional regulator n=1 Tax=Microbulbifer sp. ZKSA006 TaxID=3243390 RepID=UPI004039D5C8